jgi:hypothetical protein
MRVVLAPKGFMKHQRRLLTCPAPPVVVVQAPGRGACRRTPAGLRPSSRPPTRCPLTSRRPSWCVRDESRRERGVVMMMMTMMHHDDD